MACSIPNRIVRPPRFDDRSLFRYAPGYRPDRRFHAKARLVGLSRAARRHDGRGRDVQQQRHCREVRRRRDVSELSRDARRAASVRGRANTMRLALTGQLGTGGAGLGRRGGGAEAVRLLQGLPARMSDRRRHGEDEDRGAGGARRIGTGSACANGSSPNCRATRRLPRPSPARPIFATRSPLLRRVSIDSWALPRSARCRPGGAILSATKRPCATSSRGAAWAR